MKKRRKGILALVVSIVMSVTMIPAMAFATGDGGDDPVITNLAVTRDSETTATITFDSSQAGNVAICFKKDGEEEYALYLHDKDGVVEGKNTIKIPAEDNAEDSILNDPGAYEIAVYFGANESDFDIFLFGADIFAQPGAVKGTVPIVHTCAPAADAENVWESDGTSHWQICATCGKEIKKGDHDGGEATCTASAVCEICKQSYGFVNPANHTGTVVWTQTETDHSSAYNCCGEPVVTNQAHEFKWITDKEATATEAGSQHEECTVCGYAKEAVTIPATGTTEDPSEPSTEPETPSEPSTPTEPSQPGTPSELPADTDKPSGDQTDDATEPSTSEATEPPTGDDSNIAIWMAAMLAAGTGMAGTVLYSRKRKYNR